MASTYTLNTGIEKIGTGEQSGTWGNTTNTNFDIIDRALSGVGAITLTGTSHTLTTTDGSLTDGMFKVLVLGGSPSGTNTITIGDNTQDKLYFVVNNSGQEVQFSQGTGANATIANGAADIIYADGAGSGAAVASFFGTSLKIGNDLTLGSDSSVLNFGADSDVSITHDPDDGLIFKSTATADDNPFLLTLQTGETDLAADDVIGKIAFQAPDEGTGTDAILVSAAIQARSEGDFAADANATSIDFMTGASEAAATKMSLTSGGDVNILTDGAAIKFGADSDVTITHDPDDGLILKSTATGDDNPFLLTLQTGETDIAVDDALGLIQFQAPDEASASGDNKLVAAGITAVSEGDFSNTSNATTLKFITASSAAATVGGTDGGEMSLLSNGALLLRDKRTTGAPTLGIQSGRTDVSDTEVLGGIEFQAPVEASGSDAILVGAAINAVADADFSASSNATALLFKTGASATASEKMRITSAGKVGIGGTPSVNLHIVQASDEGTPSFAGATHLAVQATAASDDNVNASLISGTAGVSRLMFGDKDDEDAGKIEYNNSENSLQFHVGSSSTERLKIISSGNVISQSNYFKASSSSDKFYNGSDPSSGAWHEFNSSTGNEQILAITNHNTGTDNEGFVVRHVANTNNTSSGFISCANDINGTKFAVKGNGNVQSATNSYGSTSDERLKSDIKDANSQWDDIKQLRFRNFKKYDTEDLVHLGLIAQETEKISPNIVSDVKPSALDIKHDSTFGTLYVDGDDIPDGKKVGDVKEIKERVKDIKYSVLYMKAVKALQEAMARIETLEAKVKALEEA